MRTLTQYAIIDGANEKGLIDFLSEHNPPHCCLYAEPLPQELAAIAPYLVQVTDEVSAWLARKITPWGIYVSTHVTMKALRQHLRKYLQLMIPIEEKPVFFRFYDPGNIWDFCSVLSDWELHCFLGPILSICTHYNGVEREDAFVSQRKKFPDTFNRRFKMLRISQSQFEQLDSISSDKYIAKITILTETQYGLAVSSAPSPGDARQTFSVAAIVQWIYDFCKKNDITDDRSIRGLLHLFMEKEIHEERKIPEEWRVHLTDTRLPGYYRVEVLIKNALGYIPQ